MSVSDVKKPEKEDTENQNNRERLDFIAFKKRILRLAQSLIDARRSAHLQRPSTLLDNEEKIEIKLESEKVSVTITTFGLSQYVLAALANNFHRKYSQYGFQPLFADFTGSAFTLKKSRETEHGFRSYYLEEQTQLQFLPYRHGLSLVIIETNLRDFTDHFESFVTESVQALFPSTQKTEHKEAAEADETWEKNFAYRFESAGCTVVKPGQFSWKDIAGYEDIKERLKQNLVIPLEREHLYQKIAKRVTSHECAVFPSAILLYGPPGCGKTRSMKVIGSEIGLPVVIFPFQAVLTKWYGESESKLTRLFEIAREAGKMILLIDELDALAKKRGESFETTARLTSILLNELDGLQEQTYLLIIGATNDPQQLDSAVLDRFDVKIHFPKPDISQIKKVLSYYARHLRQEEINDIVPSMEGWSIRQISRFCKEVLRQYVSGLDLSQLEAEDPPLPRKEDYLKLLSGTYSITKE